jgi:uncharacterized membrane protein
MTEIRAHRRLPKPLRIFKARPRLLVCALIGSAIGFMLPDQWRLVTRGLVGWNVGVWLYLVAAAIMIMRSENRDIHRRAALQDEGRYAILAMAAISASVSIGAIFAQLSIVKNLPPGAKGIHIALAIATIIGSWLFIHLIFGLHYTHEYFRECARQHNIPKTGEAGPEAHIAPGGIDFPGRQTPDYLDFMYFSYVIGVACATADVSITSRPLRRLALMHSVLAFFFNNAVLAMTINIGSGFIGG